MRNQFSDARRHASAASRAAPSALISCVTLRKTKAFPHAEELERPPRHCRIGNLAAPVDLRLFDGPFKRSQDKRVWHHTLWRNPSCFLLARLVGLGCLQARPALLTEVRTRYREITLEE